MGKGWLIFGRGGPGFLEIAVMYFISQILFDLLFMCRLKDFYHLLFFFYIYGLLHFINSVLTVFLIAYLGEKVDRTQYK